MLSFGVQAPRTAFNSSWDVVGAGFSAGGDGAAVCDGGATGGGAAAADASGFVATASTAVLQGAERLS